jgi:very-short-patch-repair endonuclease
VPSHRLLIEFDGKQHFESSDRWGGESQLELVKKRDQIKTDFANHYGLSLLRIPFWDISNVEDLVLQALIESESQESKQK